MARDGKVLPGLEHQRLEPDQGLMRVVGVERGHRAIVAGVHGLEHVQGLAATALTDDDAVGAHRRQLLTSSRIGTAPLPSTLGGRDSSWIQ